MKRVKLTRGKVCGGKARRAGAVVQLDDREANYLIRTDSAEELATPKPRNKPKPDGKPDGKPDANTHENRDDASSSENED